MIEKNLIKKMASYILRSKGKAVTDRSIMHPKREWMTGIMVALLVSGVGIFWSIRTYNQFSHIEINNGANEEEEVVYKESMIETALADFSARKKAYEELKTQLLNKYQKRQIILPEPEPEPEPEIEISTSTEEAVVILEGEVITVEDPVTEVGEIKFE
jgi:hypothetical protein